jgi:hypothetical protein
MRGGDELDAALLELGPEVRQLLLVQLVLVRVGLEDLLLELSELLRLVDEGAGFQFSKLGQFKSPLLLLQRTGARQAPTPSKTLRCLLLFRTTEGLAWISGGSRSYV